MTVAANRPDIVFHDKINKHTLLIDVAWPYDSSVALKQTEKMTNYQLLKDEVHCMWGTSVSIVAVAVGAFGIVKEAKLILLRTYQATVLFLKFKSQCY